MRRFLPSFGARCFRFGRRSLRHSSAAQCRTRSSRDVSDEQQRWQLVDLGFVFLRCRTTASCRRTDGFWPRCCYRCTPCPGHIRWKNEVSDGLRSYPFTVDLRKPLVYAREYDRVAESFDVDGGNDACRHETI